MSLSLAPTYTTTAPASRCDVCSEQLPPGFIRARIPFEEDDDDEERDKPDARARGRPRVMHPVSNHTRHTTLRGGSPRAPRYALPITLPGAVATLLHGAARSNDARARGIAARAQTRSRVDAVLLDPRVAGDVGEREALRRVLDEELADEVAAR